MFSSALNGSSDSFTCSPSASACAISMSMPLPFTWKGGMSL